jgi:multidrug efflux pump subunit AcrA (membrane-fusion protein)
MAEIFPGPTHLGRPRRRGARRILAGGAAVALLAFGGAAVATAGADEDAGYRTATAAQHEVAQVLEQVGTIEPVSQASVAFPVSGTVERLDVKVGDTVLVGEVLAELDTTELTRTLHERQATLAEAELVLQKALDGEDVSGLAGVGPAGGGVAATGISADLSNSTATVRTVSLATGTSTTSTAPSTTAPASTTADPTAPTSESSAAVDDELRAAQQAVLDAQQAVDRNLAVAQAALDNATEVCAAVGSGSDASTPTTTPDEATAEATDDSAGIEACRTALAAVLSAQNQVAADQAALAEASRALDALLAERAADTSSGGSSGSSGGADAAPGSGTGSTASGSLPGGATTGAPSGSDTAATTSSPSAEALVAYQKAVDAAAAQVAVAEQAVDQARIVSPIAGTVVAVGLGVGDAVTADSDTATVVVVGTGGFEVTTHVTVDDVADLEVGQSASVLPDGSSEAIAGEVVRIGAADSSSGSTTYPVTVGLTGDTEGLGNGSVASVSIITARAERALAVPLSAVTPAADDGHTVTVLAGDTTRTVDVEVGAVGQRWVEITSGLEDGDEVVLADLDEPLPSSATEAREQTGSGGGQGGPGGGFTPPAGFTGGPPRGN